MSKQSPSELIEQGERYSAQGDFRRAIAHFERAAILAYTQGDDDDELDALADMSLAWGNLADYQNAIEGATRLLARARQLLDEDLEILATYVPVHALAEIDLRGRWKEIKPLLLAGLATARQLENKYLEADHLIKLGQHAVQLGEIEMAFI